MNTNAHAPVATRLNSAIGAQFAAVTLALLMSFGTLGSIHLLSASDASAGTLARTTVASTQA